MKELEFIRLIKESLSNSSHIGDDCAYLKDLGLLVTQDSLVEDIHFSTKFASAYEIGYKSIMVNLSDIFASGGIPKYITISLSLSKYIDSDFVKEFYRACNELADEFGFEVVGGDITGSDKIFISVCAIGITNGRNISSRKNAKVEDLIITTGVHGSSAAGLWLLKNELNKYLNIVEKHLKPIAQKTLSQDISTKIDTPYAMMDTSDGLMDAVFKIAEASNVTLEIDFDKIPYDFEIEEIAKTANIDYRDWVLYGGEDFQIVACLNQKNLEKLDKQNYTIIGKVKEQQAHSVEVIFKDKIEKITNIENTFDHFKEK